MIKKIIIALCLALVVFAVYFNIQKQQALQNNGKKNVLFLEYQTGLGTASEALQKIIQAFKEANPSLPFNWISVDTAYNPSVAVSALQQKLAMQKIDLVVSFGYPVNAVILPITQKAKIPTLALYNAGMDKFDSYENYQSFSHSQEDSLKPIVDFINKNADTIAILHINDIYGAVASKYIQNHYQKGKVVFQDSFEFKELDTRILVYKALQQKPKAIVVLGYGVGYTNILKTLQSNKYAGYMIGDLTTGSSYQEYIQNPDLFKNVYFSAPKVNKEHTAYINLMKKENHQEYLPINMVLYDAFDYIQHTIQNGGDFSQKSFLKQKTNHGIIETTFLPNGRSQVEMVLSVWENGKIVPITERITE